MSVTRGNIFNFRSAQFFRVTDGGLPVGQLDPSNLTNDTTSHAYKIEGTITATLPVPTFGRVEFRDGSKWQGAVDTGMESLEAITIDTNAYDLTLVKILTGQNVDTTTLVNTTMGSPGYNKGKPNQIGVILTAEIYSRDSATLGSTKYLTVIIPKCTARYSFPGLTQESGVNPSTGQITLNLQKAARDIVGKVFGTNQNFEDNEELIYTIASDKPYSLTTYVQDGTETDYTLGYLPTSSDVTSGNTTNYFSINGTVTAPTSISTTTGVVVKAAAGTAGQLAVAFYQTDFAPIPA